MFLPRRKQHILNFASRNINKRFFSAKKETRVLVEPSWLAKKTPLQGEGRDGAAFLDNHDVQRISMFSQHKVCGNDNNLNQNINTIEGNLFVKKKYTNIQSKMMSTMQENTGNAGAINCRTEYEELKQIKSIKSAEFYETESKNRNYFYFIDLQGRLFLEDTVPKNIATSLKSEKFLNFFFRQLKHNKTEKFVDYPYFSPCGKESNYVKCADMPIVFSELLNDEKHDGKYKLTWGHSLSIPFQPHKLRLSKETGRLYHPFPTKNINKFGNNMYGLLKSHLTISISNRINSAAADADAEIWYFEWDGRQYQIDVI